MPALAGALHALAHLRDEAGLVELARPALDLVEVLAQRGELLGHVLVGAEVGDGEAARAPVFEQLERGAPRLQVDVGRRRRREHRPAVDAHAGHVARERAAARLVQVGDVVGGVARRVGHAERPEPLAAVQHAQALGRDRQHLAPQPLHLLAIQARRRCRAGARGRPGGARRARAPTPPARGSAAPACPRRRRGRGGCASARAPAADALSSTGSERRQAAARPGVDDHVAHAPRADHVRAPEMHHVDQLRRLVASTRVLHRRVIRACRTRTS